MVTIPPEYLYKYKSINSAVQLVGVLDTIQKHRTYAPKPDKLNDPLEGCGVVHTGSYAGSHISTSLEIEGKGINHSDKLHVLSLTEYAASPQMWAHYGAGYKGVCIQFNTTYLSFSVHPVHYALKPVQLFGDEVAARYPNGEVDWAALFTKHQDWSYEQEWRGVFNDDDLDDEGYVSIGESNPTAVIIGHECDGRIKGYLRGVLKDRGIPTYTTRLASWTQRVRVIPYDLKVEGDGRSLREQVNDYCKKHGVLDLNDW